MILVGEMRDLETIAHRADRRRDRPPRLRHPAHAERRRRRSTASSTSSRPSSRSRSAIQLANSLQGILTQALLPTADGQGRCAALEILYPDDAVRNLIRQGKVEQIYSIMQTGTQRGMQTMEQSLAELVQRNIVTFEVARSRSSRPDQLFGLLERAGYEIPEDVEVVEEPPPLGGLRVAGS